MTDSPDLSRVLEDVRLLASRAVESERTGRLELAAHLYRETARLIQSALQRGADTAGLAEKAAEYLERAAELTASAAQTTIIATPAGLSQLWTLNCLTHHYFQPPELAS